MFQRRLYQWLAPLGLRSLQKFLLRVALGKSTYQYMCRTLQWDPRLKNCREADIVVRKDGMERRLEADWLKSLHHITHDERLTPL